MRKQAQVRSLWEPACKRQLTQFLFHGGARVNVAVESTDAWRALDQVMQRHKYLVKRGQTGGYDCRSVRDGKNTSLHSYGIACDINWNTNQLRRDNVLVTDMPAPMIKDIKAIRTVGGVELFEWGGHYQSFKDAHHFEIMASPAELKVGIDWDTVSASRPRKDRPSTWATLQRGDVGPTVAKLQRFLAAAGFDPLPANRDGEGTFGPRTDEEVRKFQASRKIDVDGNVGDQTWTALLTGQPDVPDRDTPIQFTTGESRDEAVTRAWDTTIEPDMRGWVVEQLQELLIRVGKVKGTPPGIADTAGNRDGHYGDPTQQRVKALQAANGLEADGRVDRITWAVLMLEGRD